MRQTVRVVALSLATACTSSSEMFAQGAPPAGAAVLEVRLLELRNDHGQAGCSLYDSEEGFPAEPARAAQLRWCPITAGRANCSFAPVPAGTYAVACFHDEDGDSELNRGVFGIPTEGNVVSNHARGGLGPPSFRDASFRLQPPGAVLSLRMGY